MNTNFYKVQANFKNYKNEDVTLVNSFQAYAEQIEEIYKRHAKNTNYGL